MELYQLRTFVAVAREGRLTKAAETLFTSQPAVSAHIKALEDEFGLKLFKRSAAGMTPTSAGEVLWEEAERLLNTSRDLSARAASLKGEISGRLRLGFNNGGGSRRSAELISHIAEKYPQLTFDVIYGNSGALLQAVQSRDLDGSFYEGTCEDKSIETLHLAHFNLVVIMPSEWKKELKRPDWSRLAAKPWVFVSPSCSYARFLDSITNEHDLHPQARFHVDDDRTALGLVATGQALTLTTVEALHAHGFGENEAVTIWPHFQHKLPLSLCYLSNRRDDPAILALSAAARTIWQTDDTEA